MKQVVFLRPAGRPPPYRPPTAHLVPLSSRPGTLHDFHSHEIAEQLTLLDAELFYKIEVQPYVGLAGWGLSLARVSTAARSRVRGAAAPSRARGPGF